MSEALLKYTPEDHAAVDADIAARPPQILPCLASAQRLVASADAHRGKQLRAADQRSGTGASREERLARRAALTKEAFSELSAAMASVRERATGALPNETFVRGSLQSVTPGAATNGSFTASPPGATVDLTVTPSTFEGFAAKSATLTKAATTLPPRDYPATDFSRDADSSDEDSGNVFHTRAVMEWRFSVARAATDDAVDDLLAKVRHSYKLVMTKFRGMDVSDRPFYFDVRSERTTDGYGSCIVATMIASEFDPFTKALIDNPIVANVTRDPIPPLRRLRLSAALPTTVREWIQGAKPLAFAFDGAKVDFEAVGNRSDFEGLLRGIARMVAENPDSERDQELSTLLRPLLGTSLWRSVDFAVSVAPMELAFGQALRTDINARRRRHMSFGNCPMKLAHNMDSDESQALHTTTGLENTTVRSFVSSAALFVSGRSTQVFLAHEATKLLLNVDEEEQEENPENDDEDGASSDLIIVKMIKALLASRDVVDSVTAFTLLSPAMELNVKLTGVNPFAEVPSTKEATVEMARRAALRFRKLVVQEEEALKKAEEAAAGAAEEAKEQSEGSSSDDQDDITYSLDNPFEPRKRVEKLRDQEEYLQDRILDDINDYPMLDWERFKPRTSVRVAFFCGEAGSETHEGKAAVYKEALGFDLPRRRIQRLQGAPQLREEMEADADVRDHKLPVPIVLPWVHDGRRFTLYLLSKGDELPDKYIHAAVKLTDSFEPTEAASEPDADMPVPMMITVGTTERRGELFASKVNINLAPSSSIGAVLDRIVDELPESVRAQSVVSAALPLEY